MAKKKYIITIEIEADTEEGYIPSDVMDELTETCAVQVEALTDGTMEDEDVYIPYKSTSKWEMKE